MSNAFDTSLAPTTEPDKIVAGDYTVWRREDLPSDYPPASYTLKYECRREGAPARQITITAADDSGDFLIELTSATTLAYAVGRYFWTAYIVRDSDSERLQVATGEFMVRPDRATNSDNPASLARRMLTLIEDAIVNRATNEQLDVLAYNLGVDSSATRNPAELLKHRAYWRRELHREDRKSGMRSIGVKF